MKKRKKRENEDENQAAARVVAITTGQPVIKRKNPAAVALGKLGGSKGGMKRAANLSPERRREIAMAAARARWAKRKS
jgi:hypothetical protein